eukprot:gene16279-17917_t
MVENMENNRAAIPGPSNIDDTELSDNKSEDQSAEIEPTAKRPWVTFHGSFGEKHQRTDSNHTEEQVLWNETGLDEDEPEPWIFENEEELQDVDGQGLHYSQSQEEVEQEEQMEPIFDNVEDDSLIHCIGNIRHMCTELNKCQELARRAQTEISPSPEHLLAELLDVTERLESLSSDLKADAKNALQGFGAKQDNFTVNESAFLQMDRDPAPRQKLLRT